MVAAGLSLVEKMTQQERDILPPLAQRREANGKKIEAVKKILAEPALLDESIPRSSLVLAMKRRSARLSR
jgi:hypothetical protein